MGRLSGKTCLVTAAGQGIGRASALMMAAEGARVIATDVNAEALASLSDPGIETRILNVRDPASIAAAVAACPGPDVLFNCAGFVAAGTILDCDEEQWAFSLDLNMTAMYRMCRAFLPGMLANGGGSIINMASAVGSMIAAPNRFVYGATKAGVIGLTKAIAADFITRGIRANAICPGFISTPILSSMPEKVVRMMEEKVPLGRLGKPEEIANTYAWLASDEASYINGAVIEVSGGVTI